MLRTFLSVVAAALLISVILLTPASSADTGEAIVPPGGHRSWSVEMDRSFVLNYSIEAVDGARVDVMVISADNYSLYLAGTPFTPLVGAGAENVTVTEGEVELRPGAYYVVVEAADSATRNETTIIYRIDTSLADEGSSALVIILGIGASALTVIILFFFIDQRVRRKR